MLIINSLYNLANSTDRLLQSNLSECIIIIWGLQLQLAQAINISDKTISKWERGLGCPDVSLLSDLSYVLGINIEKLLLGQLEQNKQDIGNMDNIKFYVCPKCQNIITTTSKAEISCCGRKIEPLIPKSADSVHKIKIDDIENDYFISLNHEMSKEHYINFVAYIAFDRVVLVKLYPEQNSEIRFPKIYGDKFYYYCSIHGLWTNK